MKLFSNQALDHILNIKKHYEYNLITELNFELGTSYSHYSPLMCLHGKWQELYAENLFELFPAQKQFKCMTNLKLLIKLEKMFASKDSPVPLNEIVDKENSGVRFLKQSDIFQNTNFENLAASATDLIQQCDPILFKLYTEMISYIFPIFHTSGKNNFTAFSTYRMMNCIFITPFAIDVRFPEIDYAINFIHELGHQVLFVWQTYDPLIVNPHSLVAYSGVRKTERPVLASLHAAVALAFMLKFCRSMQHSNIFLEVEMQHLIKRIEEYKLNLTQTLESLEERCSFTPIGRSILSEMFEFVDKRNNLTYQYGKTS